MPILDPILQYHLLEKKSDFDEKDQFQFYLRYLLIASKNIHKNFSTMKTLMQFKEDLKASIQLINYRFCCKLSDKDLNNPSITNHYKYLFDCIINSLNINIKKKVKMEGSYFKQDDDPSTIFFQPYIFFSKNHSWFLSDSPIAILSINFEYFSYSDYIKEFFQLIQIEIDLLAASGYTLVLCTNFGYPEFIFELICRNQFAEIHYNCLQKTNIIDFLFKFKSKYGSKIDLFRGYFYLYSTFVDKESELHQTFKKLKERQHFYFFTFSFDIKSTLKSIKFKKTRPFSYCKIGFECNQLRIRLSNIPFYDDNNENDSFSIPSGTSGLLTCNISRDDFFNWQKEKIKIIFYDESLFHSYSKYICFEDIHILKKELYVKDTLFLTRIDEKTLENINIMEKEIKSIIKKRRNRNFKKKMFLSFYNDKLKNSIEYVAYAYAWNQSLKYDFYIHRSQLYAVLEASKFLLSKTTFSQKLLIKKKNYLESLLYSNNSETEGIMSQNLQTILSNQSLNNEIKEIILKTVSKSQVSISGKFKMSSNNFEKDFKKSIQDQIKNIDKNLSSIKDWSDSKGVIYQVETGEGKSCIICLIAAILALNGKTVHIASSNIKLANRDYMDSFKFFQILGLKSAVLLHDNELPYSNKRKKSNLNSSSNNISIDNNNDNIQNLFKNNEDNYYQAYTQDDNNIQYMKFYDSEFYNEIEFKNPSRMNFSVCSSEKCNIIFSTFVNFECFYLKMLEVTPGYIDDYFDKCALLIDEADSILIDEIANGTIVSKEMKSNAKDVLIYVYTNKKKGISAKKTLEKVKKSWPNCIDLTLEDIEKMYSEIEIVNKKEFENGKKYSIEEFEVRNDKKKKKIIKKTLNYVKNIAIRVGKGLIKEFVENDGEEEEDDEDDDVEEEEEDNDDDSPVTVFKYIVPFDYDHKGILEPNKEFGGFVQQFIAIKESIENKVENMVINDISMSYLYVSHPIFVKLYGKVCGFTGTIGRRKDRDVYKEQYNLTTQKVPRNVANQRVEFPMILCKTIKERNSKIVSEILEFHRRGNPVLVIFQDLKEINEIGKLLNNNGVKYYNVFNGKNQNVIPEKIAGQENSISLGTNVCGRGTNIISDKKPLHVIISYYTSNSRVINQAHGRTARQGQKGTSRIICLLEQFLYPSFFVENGAKAAIEEFRIKDEMQAEYIELFKSLKPWIFYNNMNKQNLNDEDIKTMRDARININRIVAYNYEFPVKMSIETFLNIHSQKIFSMINCPNSKYTWLLFQRYIREMILQSWSLMINEVDGTFFSKKENKEYKKELRKLKKLSIDENSEKYKEKVENLNKKFASLFERYQKELKNNFSKLLELINNYLPFEIRYVVPSFMHIFKLVTTKYNTILESFKKISDAYISYNKIGFMSCQIGFKPFSLLSESGARITYKNLNKMNYIKDPELSYLKRTNKKICLLSITEQIDDIFNKIFWKINQILGEKTFLKLFLRRMLCGCEFGICFDFSFNNELIDDPLCLVDKDPLILFTISIRSMVPVLAGVLIICLVYISLLAKDIAEWIVGSPGKVSNEILKRGIFIFCNLLQKDLVNFVLDKAINLLEKTLDKQLEKLKQYESTPIIIAVYTIEKLKEIFDSSIGDKLNESLSSYLGEKIKNKLDWKSLQKKFNHFDIDIKRVVRISILLLFCIASFIMNFYTRNDAITNSKKTAKEYDNDYKENNQKKKGKEDLNQKINELRNKNSNYVDKEKGEKIKQNQTSEEESKINDLTEEFEKQNKGFLYNYMKFNPLDKIVKLSEFVDTHEDVLKDTYDLATDIKHCIRNNGEMTERCAKFQYSGFRDVLLQQVRIYATKQCPSILNLIGYSIRKKKQYLLVEDKGNGTLADVINNNTYKQYNITFERKIIIAYGIACAMESLHNSNIIHRNLKPSNINLDYELRPYVSDFCYAVQLGIKLPYILTETTPEFMAPEFIKDYKSNQFSFKLDVYAYGIILFMIMTETNPFAGLSRDDILSNTLNGKRPEFTVKIDDLLQNLIINCWNQEQSLRPNFTQICDNFERYDFPQFKIYKKFCDRKKVQKL